MLSPCVNDDAPFRSYDLPQSKEEGNWGPGKLLSKHWTWAMRLPKASAACNTFLAVSRRETATGVWGRPAFILMAASQRPQNVYPPCSQPTTHQQQHSQVHFDKKDKFTPRAGTEGVWGCCRFIVVFLSLLGSHYHGYGSWLYPWTISNPEERDLSVFLREGNKD